MLAGNQRSGSHALALALERRGAVAVPTEPRFATCFARHLALAGNLAELANRRRLLRCIFAFLWLWERRNRSRAQLLDTIPHSLLGLADQAEEIALQCESYGEIVNALHQRFAHRHGARISLDKVTFLHDEPILPLARHVPGLKVVHLVRDGRDVRLSWQRVWFGVRNHEEAALRWRRRVLGLRQLRECLPGHYLEVRYEDFLARPDATCERILAFRRTRRRKAQRRSG
ncbi:MAG: sulfotransferase [Halofilum sp. (in: g-proteobacteria)]|nr:sulfotransferase [Halofilum sp. (in: g-proteobacteria)]